MVFLTEIDPRAAVKGSRDPLGLVPLWSSFGRHVVGNLTTVTTSPRGFTTLLLGYYFARNVRDTGGSQAESTLALFLKFEQLAAYSRYFAAKDGDFRGVERVKRTLAATSTVRLSTLTDDQILSNQKTYGLWGLYSNSARASGLLEHDGETLTAGAREFVERNYITQLSKVGYKDGRDVVELLRARRPEIHLGGRHARLARALADVCGTKYSLSEAAFYRARLVYGGPADSTDRVQRHLADLLGELQRDVRFDRRELRAVIKASVQRGDAMKPLTHRLQRIDLLESLLAPSGAVFGFVLSRHGQSLVSVADELTKAWGKELDSPTVDAMASVQEEIDQATPRIQAGERWVKTAKTLSAGDYEGFLKLLLEHNSVIMRNRNGSDPWVRVVRGKLDVRFRDEQSDLPRKRDLTNLWRNSYFINALKDVVAKLPRV